MLKFRRRRPPGKAEAWRAAVHIEAKAGYIEDVEIVMTEVAVQATEGLAAIAVISQPPIPTPLPDAALSAVHTPRSLAAVQPPPVPPALARPVTPRTPCPDPIKAIRRATPPLLPQSHPPTASPNSLHIPPHAVPTPLASSRCLGTPSPPPPPPVPRRRDFATEEEWRAEWDAFVAATAARYAIIDARALVRDLTEECAPNDIQSPEKDWHPIAATDTAALARHQRLPDVENGPAGIHDPEAEDVHDPPPLFAATRCESPEPTLDSHDSILRPLTRGPLVPESPIAPLIARNMAALERGLDATSEALPGRIVSPHERDPSASLLGAEVGVARWDARNYFAWEATEGARPRTERAVTLADAYAYTAEARAREEEEARLRAAYRKFEACGSAGRVPSVDGAHNVRDRAHGGVHTSVNGVGGVSVDQNFEWTPARLDLARGRETDEPSCRRSSSIADLQPYPVSEVSYVFTASTPSLPLASLSHTSSTVSTPTVPATPATPTNPSSQGLADLAAPRFTRRTTPSSEDDTRPPPLPPRPPLVWTPSPSSYPCLGLQAQKLQRRLQSPTPHPLAIYTDDEWAALPPSHRSLACAAYPEIRRRRRQRILDAQVALSELWLTVPSNPAARLAHRARLLHTPLAHLAWANDDVWAALPAEHLSLAESMVGRVRELRDLEEARETAEEAQWARDAVALKKLVPGCVPWVEGMVAAPVHGSTWAALGKNDAVLEVLLKERVAAERKRRRPKRWAFRRERKVTEMNTRGVRKVRRYTLTDEGPVPGPQGEWKYARRRARTEERVYGFAGE